MSKNAMVMWKLSVTHVMMMAVFVEVEGLKGGESIPPEATELKRKADEESPESRSEAEPASKKFKLSVDCDDNLPDLEQQQQKKMTTTAVDEPPVFSQKFGWLTPIAIRSDQEKKILSRKFKEQECPPTPRMRPVAYTGPPIPKYEPEDRAR